MLTFLIDFIVKIPKKRLKCKVRSQSKDKVKNKLVSKVRSQLEDNVRNRLNKIFSRNMNQFIDQITIPN